MKKLIASSFLFLFASSTALGFSFNAPSGGSLALNPCTIATLEFNNTLATYESEKEIFDIMAEKYRLKLEARNNAREEYQEALEAYEPYSLPAQWDYVPEIDPVTGEVDERAVEYNAAQRIREEEYWAEEEVASERLEAAERVYEGAENAVNEYREQNYLIAEEEYLEAYVDMLIALNNKNEDCGLDSANVSQAKK